MSADGIGTPTVANELRQVERSGIPFTLHALRMPSRILHGADWAQRMNSNTNAIYPLQLFRLTANSLAAPFLFRRRYFSALANALFGKRESLRGRFAGIAHFFVAAHWAMQLRSAKVDLVHSQWIHSGGTVAMYGAWLLDVPFSFTGHAVDLFGQPVALDDKIRRAVFIVCISTFHRDFYLSHGADPDKLFVVYCGIDLEHFKPVGNRRPQEPFRIVAAGRLIEKKGFEYLVRACSRLVAHGRRISCVIGGNGPLEPRLRALVAELGLEHVVTITGKALKQEEIPAFMAEGDLFCLPCVWAEDGDVDGLPQLLMEAMACGLPAVSTRIVGIPDLVRHEETGLLSTPRDDEELAALLAYAEENYTHMLELVENGMYLLRKSFDIRTCLQPLLDRFEMFLSEGGDDVRIPDSGRRRR